MSRGLRIGACGAVAAVLTFAAGRAAANDVPGAQALFDRGKKLMAEGDFAEACPKFEESQRLDPALGTLLNLADCYEKAGKVATAWGAFLELAAKADAAGQKQRARIGRERAAALVPRLSKIVVNAPRAADASRVQITRDGVFVGEGQWGTEIPTDPGAHTVAASAAGRQPWSASVVVAEGKTTVVTVPDLAPLPASAAPPARPEPVAADHADLSPPPSEPGHGLGAQRVLALVSAGLGVAGIGVGTAFGLVSMSQHSHASSLCPAQTCADSTGSAAWHDAVVSGNVATIGFIAGGVGLVGGAVLWLSARREPSSAPSVQVGLGPGSMQVLGTW